MFCGICLRLSCSCSHAAWGRGYLCGIDKILLSHAPRVVLWVSNRGGDGKLDLLHFCCGLPIQAWLQCRKQNKKMYIKPQPQTQSSRHCKLHRAASACLMEEEVYCCRHPETTCTAAGMETLLHLNQYGFWQQFLSVFSQT